ncbi:hypothetical protein [Thiomonas sp.]
MIIYARIDGGPECECRRCLEERQATVSTALGDIPLSMVRMILCPKCGNKRCPHASDHRLECTGSNEPGQPGSIYPARSRPTQE